MSRLKEHILLRGIMPMAEKSVGTNAMYWYRRICEMNTWDSGKIQRWQNEQLSVLVNHAYSNTKYYKRIFDDIGITPNDIKTKDDLRFLPIIDKKVINENYYDFIPQNVMKFRYRVCKTGGTTGEPMTYLCDENVWGYVTAAKIYYWKKTGYHYGDSFAALGSSSLFGQKSSLKRRVYDWIRGEYGLNSVSLTDELCESYLDLIKKKKIRYLYGYATSLYLLSDYVLRTNKKIDWVNAVFSTSENLPDHYREIIRRAFSCDVQDCYGARDAGVTAYETSFQHYEVGYNAILEINSETKSLLSTNLINFSFPLLRYDFGDIVTIQEKDDFCVYNGQIINNIKGRTSDIMRFSNGKEISATGISMIMKEFDIKAFQLHKKGDLEVELDILPISSCFDVSQRDKLFEIFQHYLGNDCTFSIVVVDKIEPLKNGKNNYFYI